MDGSSKRLRWFPGFNPRSPLLHGFKSRVVYPLSADVCSRSDLIHVGVLQLHTPGCRGSVLVGGRELTRSRKMLSVEKVKVWPGGRSCEECESLPYVVRVYMNASLD